MLVPPYFGPSVWVAGWFVVVGDVGEVGCWYPPVLDPDPVCHAILRLDCILFICDGMILWTHFLYTEGINNEASPLTFMSKATPAERKDI